MERDAEIGDDLRLWPGVVKDQTGVNQNKGMTGVRVYAKKI